MYLIYNICCWKRVSISMFCPNKQYNTNVILAIRMARLCTYSLLMWGAIEYIYIYIYIYIYVHMDIHTALAQYNTLWSHHVYILVYLHTFSMGTENSSCTSSEPSSGGTSGCSCEPWVSHGNLRIEAAHISQWFVVNRPICIKCLPFWGGWIWRLLIQKGGKTHFQLQSAKYPPSQLQIAKQFPVLLPSGDCWPKLSSIMEWSSSTNSTVSQNKPSCPKNL